MSKFLHADNFCYTTGIENILIRRAIFMNRSAACFLFKKTCLVFTVHARLLFCCKLCRNIFFIML